MAVSRNNINSSKFRPGVVFKKNGIYTRRFLFCGIESGTNIAHTFFIELSQLNPFLSPDKAVLGFKPHQDVKEDQLQYALAGTDSVKDILNETPVQPSYVVVRIGILGEGAKQLCRYYAAKSIKSSGKSFLVEMEGCSFSDDRLAGMISYAPEDIRIHPEFMCESGSARWDLHYEFETGDFPSGYSGKNEKWFAVSARTYFTGTVVLDDKEYRVTPRTSFGSIDFWWGRSFPVPYLHVSASNLTSLISGRTLQNSCFFVHGIYGGRPTVLVNLEPNSISYTSDMKPRMYSSQWECTLMPEDESGEKLHWSVSVNSKQWIIDIDIICQSKLMFVRDFELPEGGKKKQSILCGSGGTGEIRLYRQLKKNIEMIEHAHVEHAFCEYGRQETPPQ